MSGLGRIDVDEPLRVLSRGKYRADRADLAAAAITAAATKAATNNAAAGTATTSASNPQRKFEIGATTSTTAADVLLNAKSSSSGGVTNFMGRFSRRRAAAMTRANGLRVALQNLHSDFDVVGVCISVRMPAPNQV